MVVLELADEIGTGAVPAFHGNALDGVVGGFNQLTCHAHPLTNYMVSHALADLFAEQPVQVRRRRVRGTADLF